MGPEMNRGHKGRTDDNQTEIVKALRSIGCSVAITSAVGSGFPDLVVGRHSCGTLLLEVKDGRKPPSKRKLTEAELRFHGSWLGGPIAVVDSVESAIRAIVSATK